MKTLIEKDIYTPMFTAALFAVARMWRQLERQSIDEQINKV